MAKNTYIASVNGDQKLDVTTIWCSWSHRHKLVVVICPLLICALELLINEHLLGLNDEIVHFLLHVLDVPLKTFIGCIECTGHCCPLLRIGFSRKPTKIHFPFKSRGDSSRQSFKNLLLFHFQQYLKE